MSDVCGSWRHEHVRVGKEWLGESTLVRAVQRIADEFLEIAQTGYEEEQWTAHRVTGSVNDRQWDTVAEAPTLCRLLATLGKYEGSSGEYGGG